MANIIIKTNSSSYGTVTPSTTFYLGENQRRKIEATPKSGYKFSHWSRSGNWAVLEDEGGDGDEQTLHSPVVYVRSLTSSTEQNVTFTANFEEISYTFTVYAAEGGGGYTDPPAGTTKSLHKGARISVTAYPNTGYFFNGWVAVGGNGGVSLRDNPTTFTMAAMNGGLRPKFVAKSYLSTATAPKINSSSSATVKYGTTYTINWSKISNAVGYDIYTYGIAEGSYGHDWTKHTGDVGNIASKSGMGGWSASAIGNSYRYYVQPLASSTGSYLTPSASSCNYVTVLVAGSVTVYDLNGAVLSGWNGKLVTAWSSSDVNYPAPSGYNAISYYDASSGGNKITSYSTADLRNKGGSVKLYARATKKQYVVTFNPNGGSCTPTSKTVNAGDSVQFSDITVTAPSGKAFKGWSTSTNSSGLIEGTSYKPSSDKTLYAIYIEKYTVDYNLNPQTLLNGTVLTTNPSRISSVDITGGSAITIYSTTPTMTGYTFLHWKDSSGSTYPVGGSYNKSAGTVLTAQWTANKYTPKVANPDPATAPSYTASIPSWTFNTTQTLPSAPASTEKWVPKTPFWKVTVGSTSSLVNAGGTYNFVTAGTPTLQPQWK